MARPVNTDKREKFLTAAMRLFVEKGVQNTSTAEIARAAGTAAGTLFLYFPTKQDLIHAIILEVGREQSAAINALLSPDLSARETFRVIWTGSLHWFMKHMDAYLYVQQVRDSGMVSEEVARESNRFFGYYYEAIQKGLAEGSIKPYPPELTGGVMYQSVVAIMNLIRAQPDPAAQEAYIRQGFDFFWDGIKTSA